MNSTTHIGTYRLEAFGLPQFVWLIMVRHNIIDSTMSAASVARKIPCVGGTPPSIKYIAIGTINRNRKYYFSLYMFQTIHRLPTDKRIRSANMILRVSMAIPRTCVLKVFYSSEIVCLIAYFLLCSRTNYDR